MNRTIKNIKLKQSVLCLIGVLLLFSCNNKNDYTYLNDDKLSNEKGFVKNDSVNWVPKYILRDTLVYTGIDTNRKTNISKAINEPILYNYYFGYDSYRFIWARTFHRLIILKLKKENDGIYLSCSTLQKNDSIIKAEYELEMASAIKENRVSSSIKRYHDNGELQIDTTIKINKWNEKIIFKPKKLTLKEWNEFEKILEESNFWKLLPYDNRRGLDGARWTIEAQLKNKYWFHSTLYPDYKYRKAGVYLINKSGLMKLQFENMEPAPNIGS